MTTLNPLLPLLYEPIVQTALREDLGRSLRMAVHGRYLIFFTALDDGVLIERVVHGARDRKDLP